MNILTGLTHNIIMLVLANDCCAVAKEPRNYISGLFCILEEY